MDVLDTESNDKMVSLRQTAASREQIPEAISRLAVAVISRREKAKHVAQANVPLEREATANLDALHAYALAEIAMQRGGGLRMFSPHSSNRRLPFCNLKFAQAQMRLAWLYRDEFAEVAAADAAVPVDVMRRIIRVAE